MGIGRHGNDQQWITTIVSMCYKHKEVFNNVYKRLINEEWTEIRWMSFRFTIHFVGNEFDHLFDFLNLHISLNSIFRPPCPGKPSQLLCLSSSHKPPLSNSTVASFFELVSGSAPLSIQDGRVETYHKNYGAG
jgi:hypothetical protein